MHIVEELPTRSISMSFKEYREEFFIMWNLNRVYMELAIVEMLSYRISRVCS